MQTEKYPANIFMSEVYAKGRGKMYRPITYDLAFFTLIFGAIAYAIMTWQNNKACKQAHHLAERARRRLYK